MKPVEINRHYAPGGWLELITMSDTNEIEKTKSECQKDVIDISILNRLSYWDSMVIAASEKAKAFHASEGLFSARSDYAAVFNPR